jgi:Zn-dependent peptidase ImmA (M78 family)
VKLSSPVHSLSAEDEAATLIRSASQTEPPVDLVAITKLWKDLSIVEEDLEGEGYLLPLGKLGAEIVVRRRSAKERQRFTIAHELGHWVLGNAHQPDDPRQPMSVAGENIENWCDRFAASLLMPAEWFYRCLGQNALSFDDEALRSSQKDFAVSRSAFFLRCATLYRIDVALVRDNQPAQFFLSRATKRLAGQILSRLDKSCVRHAGEFVMDLHADYDLEIHGRVVELTTRAKAVMWTVAR